jgi:hypothetical protein
MDKAHKHGVGWSRADDGIRTRDLRFTKPLLYQLSYVGAERQRLPAAATAARAKRPGAPGKSTGLDFSRVFDKQFG